MRLCHLTTRHGIAKRLLNNHRAVNFMSGRDGKGSRDPGFRGMMRRCLASLLLLLTVFAWIPAAHSQGFAVSSAATRRSIVDPNSGLHWRFEYAAGALEYFLSLDGLTWSKQGQISYSSPFFALAFGNVDGTSYVVVATENPSSGVSLHRGVISGRALRFESESVAIAPTAATERYIRPAVSLDSLNRIWVAAIQETSGSAESQRVYVARSSASIASVPVFAEKAAVGRPSVEISSLAIVPGGNEEMVLAVSGESFSNVLTYYYSGGSWGEASSGGELGSVAFAGAGMNGPVRAFALDAEGSLYAAGDFTTADGLIVNHVAMWNGSRWRPLGAGVNGPVHAVAVDSQGTVYVGGAFTSAGGVAVSNIARWDGVNWNALGSGVNQVVRALAISSRGTLYVGGDFTEAGGIAAQRIARWSGSTWAPIGAGFNQIVYGISVVGDTIYAVGAFSQSGSVSARGVAMWDGSTWRSCGEGIDGVVHAVGLDSRGNLFVGGRFETAGGVAARNIARWDGASWTNLGDGVSATIAPGSLVVDSGRGRVYVGGAFDQAGGVAVNRLAQWTGTGWLSIGDGVDAPVSALLLDLNGKLLIGGEFATAGSLRVSRIAEWSGDAWSKLTGSGINGVVRAILVHPNGDLYVGGNFTEIGGIVANRIARWSGSRWHALGAGVNDDVHALALDSAGRVYAAGDFTQAGGVSASHVALWSGAAWTAVGGGLQGTIFSIAVDASDRVYVGGKFQVTSDIAVSNIAVLDGATWSSLGAGFDDAVLALTIDPNGTLYAGGAFRASGRRPLARVAMWRGVEWTALGGGVDAEVRALISDSEGIVYAGGDFTQAGGAPARHVAQWRGGQWYSLGDGTPVSVSRLALDGRGALVAGSDHQQAGVGASALLSVWTDGAWRALGNGGLNSVSAMAVDVHGTLYVGSSSGMFALRLVSTALQSPRAGLALLPGDEARTHLFYVDRSGRAIMKSLLAAPRRWGPAVTIYQGRADSLVAATDLDAGYIRVWIRDGDRILFSRFHWASLTLPTPQLLETGRRLPGGIGDLEGEGGARILADWGKRQDDQLTTIDTATPMPSSTATPTPTPTQTSTPTGIPVVSPTPTTAASFVVDFRVVREVSQGEPQPLSGVWVEVKEDSHEESLPRSHRALIGRDGRPVVPIAVHPDAELLIQSGEPRLAAFQVSGAASEFAPEQEIRIVATPMIEPLDACREERDGATVSAVFRYANTNQDSDSTAVSITGLSPELYGESSVTDDDLLLNSLDYANGRRVIPDLVLHGGLDQKPKQYFVPGEGKFSVAFDPALGELTWSMLGARLAVSSASPACPLSAAQQCKAIQATKVRLIINQVQEFGKEVTRAVSRINRRAVSAYRRQAGKAVEQVRELVVDLTGALECPAGVSPASTCTSRPFPIQGLIQAHNSLFKIRNSRVNRKIGTVRLAQVAKFQQFIESNFSGTVSYCP